MKWNNDLTMYVHDQSAENHKILCPPTKGTTSNISTNQSMQTKKILRKNNHGNTLYTVWSISLRSSRAFDTNPSFINVCYLPGILVQHIPWTRKMKEKN